MDEVYQAFPGTPLENVYLNNFLTPSSQDNKALNASFIRLLELRDAVLKALEEARTAKAIGKSLEASITLQLSAQDMDVMAILPQPEKFFIVSSVTLEKADAFKVIVEVHPGEKCERCWHHVDHVHEGVCDRCSHVLEDLYGA
jgi:isoleucyl-tRNA synthetase